MREIKFRAWDWEKMFKIERIDFYDNSLWIFEENDWLYKPNTIIMQYTWLKDKNWVDIYEGDVLELSQKAHLSIKWKVVFINWWFELRQIKWNRLWYFQDLLITEWFEFKIISNIYENPNLLDNK